MNRTGLVALTAIARANEVFLNVQGDQIYALAYHHALARTSLRRVRRDGRDTEELGRYAGLGPPASFTMFAGRAYYWRKKAIFSVDLATRDSTVVASGVARPFAVDERGVFALRCGDAERPDELVRIDPRDGERTVAVMPARALGTFCGYRYVAIDATSAFVSDWGTRRIYRIALASGELDILVQYQGYPLRSLLEPSTVVFHAAGGLYRVPRAGGEAERLSEIGKVPYSTLADDAESYWIYSSVRFTPIHGLYRIPKGGGHAERIPTFEPFSKQDPLYDAGFVDLAVDEQCLYFARYGHNKTPSSVVSIVAQRKPAAPSEEPKAAALGKGK